MTVIRWMEMGVRLLAKMNKRGFECSSRCALSSGGGGLSDLGWSGDSGGLVYDGVTCGCWLQWRGVHNIMCECASFLIED